MKFLKKSNLKKFVNKFLGNTAEEASKVEELIGRHKTIILVTATNHMDIACSHFQKNEFNVSQFKIDYKLANNYILTIIFLYQMLIVKI